jgi:hypothetical protein
VVDAARRSIQALAKTSLVAKAVKAGETAPLFGLRCRRGDFINLPDLLNRGHVEIAARYRIAFTVPQHFRAAYLALGYPNSAKTGSKGFALPIPATYILDSTGLVVLSYLDADHTTRLEPTEIIAALTHLHSANIPGRNNR